MHVCDLSAAVNDGPKRVPVQGKADVVTEEFMSAKSADSSQNCGGFSRGPRIGRHTEVAGDSDKSGLCDARSRPPFIAVSREPVACWSMVDVIGPGKREEDIDVEELHHSSSASRTRSGVIGAVSGATSKVGNPTSITRGLSPRRASSDTAAPRDVPGCADIARAAARTASSRSSVVRITTS